MAKKPTSRELGFGSFGSQRGQRIMNRDGSANVRRIGGPAFSISDNFHRLTTMPWSKFFLLVFAGYMVANLLFAFAYFVSGAEHLGIQPSGNAFHDFLECFFFSTQCFTTIGFGRVNPQGMSSNLLASLEGLIGLLSLAMATGLLYGRFSRPRAHLLHSDNLLIAPYRDNQHAAMFRIASTRKHSLLIENSVSLSVGFNEMENGSIKRRFFILNLEIDKINFLASSWTLVHPINEESPLWGMSWKDIETSRMEFMVLFKAMEETTSQTVLERFSYFVDDIVWAAKFQPMIGTTDGGQPALNLNFLNKWEASPLPETTGSRAEDNGRRLSAASN